MSINAINNADSKTAFQNRILAATGAGALVGGVYTAKDKQYLYKGLPSDVFVRDVGRNLRKEMTSDEIMESAKVYKFVEKAVDPEVDLESLKPMIKDSKELSEAIKSNPQETIEEAITRVFSQKDTSKIKEDLLDLQYKTKSDKKTGRNTSLKLLHDNFDAGEQKLVKNKGTTEAVFNMLKNTATKIQIKTVAVGATLAGLAAGALCLIASDVPGAKNN